MTRAGTEEAIVPDLDESLGQNMLQETTNELLSGEGAEPGLICAGFGVAEGDLPISQLEDTLVTDGHSEDVGSQILQGGRAIADRLAVNDPLLLPCFCGH